MTERGAAIATTRAGPATDPAADLVERRTFRVCLSGWSADAYDNQVISITLPLIVGSLALSPAGIGAIVALTVASMAIGGWIGGAAADRWGRLRLLRYSIAWFALWSIPVACSQSAAALAVSRTMQGFGLGAEWAAGVVLMADAARPANRARLLAGVQSGWAIGWGLAAVVSLAVGQIAFVTADQSWRLATLIGAVPACLALWLSTYLRETGVAPRAGALRPLAVFAPATRRKTFIAMLLGLGAHGGYYGVFTWIPSYLRNERSLTGVELTVHLLIIITAFGAGCLISGRIAGRFGSRRCLVAFALACIGSGLLYAVAARSTVSMTLLGALLGFFAAGVPASIGAILVGLFPPEARATGVGFCYNAGRLLGAIFPLATGMLALRIPLSSAIAVALLSAYGIVAVAALMLPEPRKNERNVEPA